MCCSLFQRVVECRRRTFSNICTLFILPCTTTIELAAERFSQNVASRHFHTSICHWIEVLNLCSADFWKKKKMLQHPVVDPMGSMSMIANAEYFEQVRCAALHNVSYYCVVCCSVLQCVAVCCSVCCSVLQYFAVCCSVCYSVLQCAKCHSTRS